MEKQKIVLEPSSNTHFMTSAAIVEENPHFMRIKASPNQSTVVHGEHGPLLIESTNVLKFNQTEFNPVQKVFTKVFD